MTDDIVFSLPDGRIVQTGNDAFSTTGTTKNVNIITNATRCVAAIATANAYTTAAAGGNVLTVDVSGMTGGYLTVGRKANGGSGNGFSYFFILEP